MKISEGGRVGEGGGPFERMDHAQLIQGFSDQRWQMPIFLFRLLS